MSWVSALPRQAGTESCSAEDSSHMRIPRMWGRSDRDCKHPYAGPAEHEATHLPVGVAVPGCGASERAAATLCQKHANGSHRLFHAEYHEQS